MAPMPITASRPTVIPAFSMAPAHMMALSFTVMPSILSDGGYLSLVKMTPGPMKTLFPMMVLGGR